MGRVLRVIKIIGQGLFLAGAVFCIYMMSPGTFIVYAVLLVFWLFMKIASFVSNRQDVRRYREVTLSTWKDQPAVPDPYVINLTPAESLVILDLLDSTIENSQREKAQKADKKSLFTLSLLDLLLKRVFKLRLVEHKRFWWSEQRYLLEKGIKYLQVELKPHEAYLRKLYLEDVEIRSFARKFDGTTFKEYVQEDLFAQGYLTEEPKRILGITLGNHKVLNEKGNYFAGRLRGLLDTGRTNFNSWLENDPARAKTFLLACGPNFLLLDNDLQQLQEWARVLSGVKIDWSDGTLDAFIWPDFYLHSQIFSDIDLGELLPGLDLDFDFDFDLDFFDLFD